MGELTCHLVSLESRSAINWGRVVFATQETSPYDIAVVSVEEDLDGVPVPVPAEHFHEGNEQRVPLVRKGPWKISVGHIKPTDQGPAPQVSFLLTPAGVKLAPCCILVTVLWLELLLEASLLCSACPQCWGGGWGAGGILWER